MQRITAGLFFYDFLGEICSVTCSPVCVMPYGRRLIGQSTARADTVIYSVRHWSFPHALKHWSEAGPGPR